MLSLLSLTPLLKKCSTWYTIFILVLTLLLFAAQRRYRADEALLSERATTHVTLEQHAQIVRVAGPVRVQTKTVYVPGTTTVQYVERTAERGAVTTTTQKESEAVKDTQPACPQAAKAPWRYAGVIFGLGGAPRALRGGLTLWDRLDVGLSYDWKYRAAGVEAALRF